MELKTLKDLVNKKVFMFPIVYPRDLKAEAIKLIKLIESGEEVTTGKMSFKWDKMSPYTGAVGAVLIDYLKHHNNISEEDLK